MSTGTRTSAHSPQDGNPPPLDLSGRTMGDYHVLRKLGQGGMGQVYLAEQVSLKRKVALKILRPDLAASLQALERFKREALSVAKVTHANIVQVYQFDQHEGIHYMVLEYVEGRNLKEYLAKKGPPDLLVALSIMRQVASALQRAHELGIVHRDVKPENILLTRKGEVKVADFGLSRRLEGEQAALNLTQTGVTMGTPLYMSPEQVEGKETDARTDIYSFGVTCYHMLAGHPPFTGATAFEVAVQHVNKQPVPLSKVRPDLPEALNNIVLRMMAKEPAQRYQTARDLLRDLVRLREGLSSVGTTNLQPTISVEATALPSLVDSTPSAATQAIGRRRGRLLAGVLGSLALAGLAGAGLAWMERLREGPQSGTEGVKSGDAAVVETILLPNKREQALRTLVDQALSPPTGKVPDGAFGNCMELGLIYLDHDRLDDADRLFSQLEALKLPTSLKMLGQLGKGIVLALRSRAKESNKLLCEVLASEPRWIGPVPSKPKKGGGNLIQLYRQLLPIKPFLDHDRGKYWLGQARLYNSRNGIAPSAVPRYLLVVFPLEGEGKK